MTHLRALVGACLLATGALFAGAPPAAATPCVQELTDSQGFGWAVQEGGRVVGPGEAGFDDLGVLEVDVHDNGTFTRYDGQADTCGTPEETGREIVFLEQDIDGLEVTRKVYVPDAGPGFIRWLDVIHNASPSFTNLGVEFKGNAETATDLRVTGTSSGDQLVTNSDAWITWDDGLDGVLGFTAAGQLMDATGPNKLTAYSYFDAGQFLRDGDSDSLEPRYSGGRLAPGETYVLMHFAVQRDSFSETNTFALVHGGGSPELYAGLSAGERLLLQNWPVDPPSTDQDSDGVSNAFDSCPADANAGQEDLDGDGVGDPCDSDEDGDALSDAVEAALGSDPRGVDTDGDEKRDGADACPTLSSASPSGCPEAAAAVDRRAPSFTLRQLPSRMKRPVFLRRGLPVSVDPDERSSFVFELVGTLRGARIARAGDVLLAKRSLGSSAARRTVRLRPARRLRSLFAKRIRVELRVTAVDEAGNTRTTRRRISIH
jgi:hypothetical protein